MISFVGAGPGSPDLITLRAANRLADAHVVVWASSLVPESVLEHANRSAVIHDSSTMTLEDVIGVYESNPEPALVVRLHSGDPSIYSSIGEQIDWCKAAGRPWEIVPGVTSLAAAAAALGRELTQPGVAQSVVITRLAGRTSESMPQRSVAGEGPAAFAPHGSTLAVFLSASRPDELQAELLSRGSGYDESTPAAVVARVSWPDEQIYTTTVGKLADTIRSTGLTMTVLVVVGDALGDGPVARRSHLYSPAYTTTYRLRSSPGTSVGRPSAKRRGR